MRSSARSRLKFEVIFAHNQLDHFEGGYEFARHGFCKHGKEIGKLGRHLMKPRQESSVLIRLIINHQIIAITLDDRVVHDNTNIYYLPHMLFH